MDWEICATIFFLFFGVVILGVSWLCWLSDRKKPDYKPPTKTEKLSMFLSSIGFNLFMTGIITLYAFAQDHFSWAILISCVAMMIIGVVTIILVGKINKPQESTEQTVDNTKKNP